MKQKIILFISLFSFCFINAFSQKPDFSLSNKYYKKALNYYMQKKYDSLTVNMEKALEFRPNHPRILYNLAASYSLNNKKEKSVEILRKIAGMGLFYQVKKDSDFAAIMNENEFIKIVEQFERNKAPINNSKVKLTYPEKDLITESVAYDPATGAFYLSSIHKRKIVKIDKDGNTNDFKSEKEDGLQAIFGMKIDQKHRLLYACSSPIKEMEDYLKDKNGESSIYKYNLDKGQLIKKYSFSSNGSEHLLGDLTIDKDGNVYVSDSRVNSVYKINSSNDKIEQVIKPGKFISLQGLDFDEDCKNLYLADYALGLYRFNLESGKLTYIKPSDDFVPQGIDGLYYYKNSLIAIQNGVNPQRVIQINLNEDEIKNWKVLEANNKFFNEVTLGTIEKDKFYYIANGQWNSFNKDGTIFSLDKLEKPVVLCIEL